MTTPASSTPAPGSTPGPGSPTGPASPAPYAQALRALLETQGKPVQFLPPQRWRNPQVPEVSYYGDWLDFEADLHTQPAGGRFGGEGCTWTLMPGAQVTEDTFTDWGGTFGTDTHVVGINATPARCACGRYTEVTLRYEKPLSATLGDLFGTPPPLITL